MKQLFYLLILILLIGCNNSKDITTQQTKPRTKENATPYIYNCHLIEKEFVNKGGKMGDFKELYLSCSVQDYFIKFCESNVTKKDLEPYMNKGITVEIEIREGRWDSCNDNLNQVQSRTGSYIIIKAIK